MVLFYSFSGSVASLARFVAEGAASVADTEVEVKQVPELLPEEVFARKPEIRKIRERLNKEFPVAKAEDLVKADAVAFGTPTHFGSLASQMKQFIDQLTPAWLQRKLINKPAAFFCTAGSMHGGEELALLSLMIPAFNLGMIPVGIPYPIQGENPDFDSGSPYGAIYVTGRDRELSEGDKKVARILGRRLAAMAHILNSGCKVCKECYEMVKKLE